MSQYSITELTGNPLAEATEIEGDAYDGRRPSDALPDSPDLEREMAEAFGWDIDPTEAEMEQQYAAMKCDEADLLARHPGLSGATDQTLIDLIADPAGGEDSDELAAVAAILLERRLTAGASLVPLLKASLAYEAAKRG